MVQIWQPNPNLLEPRPMTIHAYLVVRNLMKNLKKKMKVTAQMTMMTMMIVMNLQNMKIILVNYNNYISIPNY